MALQLRMTHSLGQRLVEMEARSADQPIVVGRASNAEVQIPSASIAKRHCLLFVHEGRWVLQDADSPTGTFLNGERLSEPAFVNSGDVIALGRGSNPPTLTVDPHSVGVSEQSEEPAPAMKAAAAQASSPWSPPAVKMPAPTMPPPLMPPQPVVQSYVQDEDNIFGAPAPAAYAAPVGYAASGSVPGYGVPVAPPVDEWGTATAAGPDKPRRRIVRPNNSGANVAIAVLLGVLILIGGAALIYHNYQKSNEIHIEGVAPPNKTTTTPPKSTGSKSIFEEGTAIPDNARIVPKKPTSAPASNAPEVVPTPKLAASKPAAAATQEMEAAADKRRDDPEWEAVEAARAQNTPVTAIVKYREYLERHPDSPNKKDIEAYTDQAVDMIWWMRISQLFERRDNAQKEIASLKAEIAISQDADFKKENAAKIAKATEDRDAAEAIIRNEMKFTGQVAPNYFDVHDLAIARKTRDSKYYEETWKRQVLNKILGSNGQQLPFPWPSAR